VRGRRSVIAVVFALGLVATPAGSQAPAAQPPAQQAPAQPTPGEAAATTPEAAPGPLPDPAAPDALAEPALEAASAQEGHGVQEGMEASAPLPAGLEPLSEEASEVDPVRSALWQAWSLPSADLAERVHRTQRAGLALGVGSLDGPARALLIQPAFGPPLERARLAVELAPALPAAHAALAAARLEAWDFSGAADSFRAALAAAWNHLEARLWLEATGLDALFGACLGTALLFLALAAAATLPRFVRDLRSIREVPGPSAGALAATLVLLPPALGEGLAGLGLGLASFALLNGSWWRRFWVATAAAGLLVALYPVLERRAVSHASLAEDPIALAAWATEQGVPSASELARVVRAADADPLAARALALRLARQGELAEAERRYAALLAREDEPELLANAAAVRLLRGDVESAIALYEQAAKGSPSAVVRFNLAQAYGRAIRLDAQDLALAEAQALDPNVLAELNHRYNGQDGAFVAYLPLRADSVLPRFREPGASDILARALRAPVAPGVLGESRGDAVVALWIAVAVGLGLGAWLRRMAGPEQDLYAAIARLLQSRGGDSVARMAQLAELRARHARGERFATLAAWLVPGAAGMVARRPLLALLGSALFASGASLWLHRNGLFPDPLVLGALSEMLVTVALGGLALAYLLVLALALALREKV
jgi:tetratricopeptide (TPR) repeat protein